MISRETSTATFTCASKVLAPRCGVTTSFSWAISFLRISVSGGSWLQTSKPAPATLPESSASSIASSLMIPPRAALMMMTPSFMAASSFLPIMSRVSSVSGVCTVMMSQVRIDFVQRHQLDAQVVRPFLGDVGVAGDDFALEGLEAGGDAAADLAEADDAGGPPLQLVAGKGCALPGAAFKGCVCLGDVAAEGEQQRHGVLGGTVRVAERGVDDDDPFGAGVIDIDVVHADAGARHHLQVLAGVEQGLVDRGAASGDDNVVIANDRSRALPS